jgi:hypothetical protein
MRQRIAWAAGGFCWLVLAVAAQNPGSATSRSQFPHLLRTGGTAVLNSDVKLSSTSLVFGTVTIDKTSAPKHVTLTNDGAAALNITGIAIAGANAKDFAQTNSCEGSLAAGASCTITVTFKPTGSGSRTAKLNIRDSPPALLQTVSLGGVGAAGSCVPLGRACAPGSALKCCGGLVCRFHGGSTRVGCMCLP